MSIRAGLLLLLLLMGSYCPAQPTKTGNDMARFRRRMAALGSMQRLEPTIDYCRQLLEQSQFDQARTLLQEALATARQAHVLSWEGRLCLHLGGLESTAGNNTKAIDYFLQALAIFRKTHEYDQQQDACYSISNEYYTLQNTPKSQDYLQQANQLASVYKRTSMLSWIYGAEGDKASRQGSQDSALLYYRKCLTVFRATRQWLNFYSFLDGIGVELGKAGRYREAEQTFHRCLDYARRQGDKRREMYEYMHLPEPLLHLGQPDEAQRYAKLALSRIERDPERQNEHKIEVYEVMTRIAEARGEYQQALAYERLRNQYAGQVQNADKSRQVAEVESRFQVAQKQARIDRLDQDNRRQLNQISWQAGGLVALLALLGLALWQYRQIRRVNARLQSTNQTISRNNEQINEQAERLAVLMRELHHRVKNNLAIVSSLLRMQSRRLDDPRAMRAVQDGQRRVEAISLIHQQFYQTENLAEVAIKTYVTELTEGLLLGYGFDPETFDCQIEVADLLLDVEVAVPLGLLLNEVLTNAFKYAYTDMVAGNPERPNLATSGTVMKGRANPGRATSGRTARTLLRPSLLVRLQPAPEGGLLVEVQDNGPGLDRPGLDGPGLSSPGPTGQSQSFGQRLIRELTGQLGGEMTLTNRQGTYFRLWIPAQT
ncbi:tetratricopeptide repeat-containing sensor histidine kinase [Spirosoma radiotolerans]|uniref:tetratricopeptide repeat-containing sensor histidine kinase n=1 Tax=Spirosoma radiotolerans TaxID=1379870 RepID=UPI000698F432|nr:histidine kinase dimerization/phosphoacceptor domain -containing protein [Spirosoma radiotolerans]